MSPHFLDQSVAACEDTYATSPSTGIQMTSPNNTDFPLKNEPEQSVCESPRFRGRRVTPGKRTRSGRSIGVTRTDAVETTATASTDDDSSNTTATAKGPYLTSEDVLKLVNELDICAGLLDRPLSPCPNHVATKAGATRDGPPIKLTRGPTCLLRCVSSNSCTANAMRSEPDV